VVDLDSRGSLVPGGADLAGRAGQRNPGDPALSAAADDAEAASEQETNCAPAAMTALACAIPATSPAPTVAGVSLRARIGR